MTTIATQIRDAMFTRLTTPAFPWLSTRKIPVPPIQIGQLPALGVYLIRENFTPDGDSNVGPPRYIVDAVIGVMVMEESSTPSVLEGSMDALVDLIEDTILTDPTFLTIKDSNGEFLIDSVPNISRTYDFPKDGETQYIQARLQFTVRFMVIYPPVLTNNFNTMLLTVQPPNQGSVSGIASTMPDNFTAEFETTPPVIAITSIGGSTATAAQTIAGTVVLGSGSAALNTIYLYDSAFPMVPLATATASNGIWSASVTLVGLGYHSIYAAISDAIGNTGLSAPVLFTLVSGTP